ncbi:hypothetical protein CIHG_10245 [Coccidioides immitis H538.4]|uniref:Uncharacterized protein n=1 Tax=Coccidioides immitis H538.4 TaxID=396776 RepID=A0A0J8S4Q9_COCIT|nr:hypothetical protein CIHG_10245 [Coccidioides immitis H538.4]
MIQSQPPKWHHNNCQKRLSILSKVNTMWNSSTGHTDNSCHQEFVFLIHTDLDHPSIRQHQVFRSIHVTTTLNKMNINEGADSSEATTSKTSADNTDKAQINHLD